MKRIVLIAVLIFSFSAISFAELFEGIDYYASYQQKPQGYADILHINFITLMPSPTVVIEILQKQLEIYGTTHKNKNIVGTAWHTVSGDEKDLRKIKFSDSLGAYVWMSGQKRVVTFTNYLYLLKRERDNRRRSRS
jgi:hypothetical protein